MKSIFPASLISIGVLIFLGSFVVPTSVIGIVFLVLVLACAFVASGLLMVVANRKYKVSR